MDLNRFTGFVRRCVDDYKMLVPGDMVAVGVSGGKDSMALLASLRHLRRYHPSRFELEAITIDMGFPDMDFTPVSAWCEANEVPYTIIKTDIREIVFDARQEENPCSLCSKMRRGALNDAIKARGCNKLALGHHFDDAVETFFTNLFNSGSLDCFSPKSYLSRKELWLIRPLVFCGERQVAAAASRCQLPVVKSSCPADGSTSRQRTKELIARLEKDYPDLKSKVMGAVERAGIAHWDAV